MKKKGLATTDTPLRRSKRLMKLKADDNLSETYNQQPNDSSSTALLPPAQPPEIMHRSGDTIAVSDNDDNLEDLAMEVFKNMKRMLVASSEDPNKSGSSVEQHSEVLMLDSVKIPYQKTQL